MTLVTFTLAEVDGGIRPTIRETGFDRRPPTGAAPSIRTTAAGAIRPG